MKAAKGLFVLHWKENPLLQLLLFFCIGKVVFDFWSPPFLSVLVSGLLIGLLSWTLFSQKIVLRLNQSVRYYRTAITWIAYGWMGLVVSSLHYEPIQSIQSESFTCIVEENLGENTPGRWRLFANLSAYKNQNQWTETEGKVLLNVDGDAAKWVHGSQLLVAEPLQILEPPAIPGQFNAQKFYHRQGIDYQVWTRGNYLKLLPETKANPIKSLAFEIRSWMENKILEALPNREDAYMMNALLLGIRRKIDPDLKAAYSAAGVTHILAVSGMHVGLILWFLTLIFGWLKRRKNGQIVFSCLVILLLWFYALITGLSPSVLRAVTVFTVFLISDAIGKSPLPINSLCLATVILFAFNPDIIYDVGYQLSFSAVYGISSFLGPIEEIWKPAKTLKLWRPIKWVVKEGWGAVAISTAATLGTFPIILFYFHQFPTYFLLANLIAVPVSTGLIFAAIGILILSPFPVLAKALGWLSAWVIFGLNAFVVWISALPFSLLDDVFLFLPQILLIVFALIGLQLWMRNRSFPALNSSLILVLVCCVSSLAVNAFRWKNEPINFALHAKAGWQLGRIENRKLILADLKPRPAFYSSEITFEMKALKEGFHTIYRETAVPEWRVFAISKKDSNQQTLIGSALGKTYLLLGNYLNFNTPQKIPIDFLIVDKGGIKTLEKAISLFEPKEIWVKMNPKKLETWKSVIPKTIQIRNFWKEKFQKLEPDS